MTGSRGTEEENGLNADTIEREVGIKATVCEDGGNDSTMDPGELSAKLVDVRLSASQEDAVRCQDASVPTAVQIDGPTSKLSSRGENVAFTTSENATDAPVLLKEAALNPNWDAIGYKLVAKRGDRYFSFWAGESFEYELGVTITEEAQPNKQSGLYVCQTRWSATHQKVIASAKGIRDAPRALLLCACQGPFVEYYAGKAACSSITPLGEVPIPKNDIPTSRRGQWNRLAGLTGRRMDGTNRVRVLTDWDFIGYIIAAASENGYTALRACAGERVEYQLGVKHEQADTLAGKDSSGLQVACFSLCVSPTPLAAVRNDMSACRDGFETGRLSLLWCACEGPAYEDPEGKLVCTKLTPLGEVNLPDAFLQEVPVKPPAKPQPEAGFIPSRSRKRSGLEAHSGGSKCNTSVNNPRNQSASPQKAAGRFQRQRPCSASARVGADRPVRRPPVPVQTSKPAPVHTSKAPPTPHVPEKPQRPQSAPTYRPTSRLHSVLTRWGTPESDACPVKSSVEEVARATRPVAPRPMQARPGLWVGRSATLSGCV